MPLCGNGSEIVDDVGYGAGAVGAPICGDAMTLEMEGRRVLLGLTLVLALSAAMRERMGEEATAWSRKYASGLEGRDEGREKEVLAASGLPTTLRLARRSMPAMEGARTELVAEMVETVRTRVWSRVRSSSERKA